MGIFGELFGAIGEGIAEGIRGSNSDERTWHTFTSNVAGELKTDKQYMEVFKAALASIRENRTEDTYIAFCSAGGVACAKQISGCLDAEKIGHLVGWRIYCGKPWDEKLSFKLRLLTPNALQKGTDGNSLKNGDKHEVLSEKLIAEREALLKEREALRNLPMLKSFLGVNLGNDYQKYALEHADILDQENGLMLVPADTNHLLEFTSYYVIKSFDGSAVIGVACSVAKQSVDDEFISKVISILSEKYHRNCNELESNNQRNKRYVMNFFKDEVKKEEPLQKIFIDVKSEISITALDVCATQKAMAAYLDMKRREKAQKDEADKNSALDAL